MSLFDYDGLFMRVCNFITNSFLITVLWLVTSLPILTIGASTTAAYEVSFDFIRKKDVSVMSQYFRSFARNLKQTIPAGIIMLFLLANSLFFMISPNLHQQIGVLLSIVYLVFMMEFILMGIYIFPLLSKFNKNFITVLKMAFLISHTNLLSSIICLVLLIGIVVIGLFWPPFLLLGAGGYCLCSSFYFNRIFNKYELM